jgi:hypothetical protein
VDSNFILLSCLNTRGYLVVKPFYNKGRKRSFLLLFNESEESTIVTKGHGGLASWVQNGRLYLDIFLQFHPTDGRKLNANFNKGFKILRKTWTFLSGSVYIMVSSMAMGREIKSRHGICSRVVVFRKKILELSFDHIFLFSCAP